MVRNANKPLTRVSKRVIGAHGKSSLERGWHKRVGEWLSNTLQLCNSRNARLEERVCDSMGYGA